MMIQRRVKYRCLCHQQWEFLITSNTRKCVDMSTKIHRLLDLIYVISMQSTSITVIINWNSGMRWTQVPQIWKKIVKSHHIWRVISCHLNSRTAYLNTFGNQLLSKSMDIHYISVIMTKKSFRVYWFQLEWILDYLFR